MTLWLKDGSFRQNGVSVISSEQDCGCCGPATDPCTNNNYLYLPDVYTLPDFWGMTNGWNLHSVVVAHPIDETQVGFVNKATGAQGGTCEVTLFLNFRTYSNGTKRVTWRFRAKNNSPFSSTMRIQCSGGSNPLTSFTVHQPFALPGFPPPAPSHYSVNFEWVGGSFSFPVYLSTEVHYLFSIDLKASPFPPAPPIGQLFGITRAYYEISNLPNIGGFDPPIRTGEVTYNLQQPHHFTIAPCLNPFRSAVRMSSASSSWAFGQPSPGDLQITPIQISMV